MKTKVKPILLIGLFLFSSCTVTGLLGLGGDSKEAAIKREKFCNRLLNSSSPENCGFDSLSQQFGWCVTNEDVSKINNRVILARKKIIDFLYHYPNGTHIEITTESY